MTDLGGVLALLGLALFVVGLVSLFRPLRPLIRSRRDAAIALVGGLALFVGGMALIEPAEVTRVPEATGVAGLPLKGAGSVAERVGPAPETSAGLTIRKVDQSTVLEVDPSASAGRFDVSIMPNDDGTQTILSRAYVSAGDMAVMVDQGLAASKALLDWCRNAGRLDCRQAKDAYVWVDRVGSERGSLGFLFVPADWSSPVSTPAEAGDRADLLPGDQFGREGLGVWCNIHREQPEGFCRRVRAHIPPQF